MGSGTSGARHHPGVYLYPSQATSPIISPNRFHQGEALSSAHAPAGDEASQDN
jgi:hypothetical protein